MSIEQIRSCMNKENRIMFLTQSLKCGGAERMVSRLANGFSARGYNVSVALFDADEMVYDISESVTIIDLGVKNNNKIIKVVNRVIKLRNCMKEIKPDIVFAFMVGMVPFAILSNCVNSKVIGTERTNPECLNIIYKMIIRIFSPLCDGYVFQTKGAKEYYPRKVQRKSVIIGNIAPSFISSKRKDVEENSIVSVGRLHSDKDFETLLKAFQLVKKGCPTAILHIYGDGPHKNELMDLSCRLDIEKSVVFEGFTKNIYEKLQKNSIFVFSSKKEGMPNALIEAMALGMPCISTDCRFGPSELITDGYNGCLVDVGDYREMAKKIIDLLNDKEKRAKYSEHAKEIVYRYSEENILEKYITYASSI